MRNKSGLGWVTLSGSYRLRATVVKIDTVSATTAISKNIKFLVKLFDIDLNQPPSRRFPSSDRVDPTNPCQQRGKQLYHNVGGR